MIAVGKADECIQEEILRHEEISGLAEKRLSSEYKRRRKDLGQFEGSPSKKARNLVEDVGVHKPMRKRKGSVGNSLLFSFMPLPMLLRWEE
eukprot:1140486-Pyramimonas_sp.AAC.1